MAYSLKLMAFECAILKFERLVVDGGINDARKMFQSLEFIILLKGNEIFSISLYAKAVFLIRDNLFKPCSSWCTSIASEHLNG